MYRCLAQFPADGTPARVWTKDNGLPSREVLALGQDRDGNLWLGTADQGTFKLAAGGILTYSSGDEIGMDVVISVGETLRGELYIAGNMESGPFRIGFRRGGFCRTTPVNGGLRAVKGYAGIPVWTARRSLPKRRPRRFTPRAMACPAMKWSGCMRTAAGISG
jgi:hypothetical protein